MNNKRAYSLLTVKAIDEEKREITGIATTPTPDRTGDVVEPKGAEFKLPIPLLSQHDPSKPIGHVIKARVTDEGIEITARLVEPYEGAPQSWADRLNEAWADIKTGLVRGLSIGFRPVEYQRIAESYAYRYVKWLWLELSAVTIPANGDCSIQAIKSIDTELRAASGNAPRGGVRLSLAGASAITTKSFKPTAPEANNMKTYAEQIAALEAARKEKSERMDAIMSKSIEGGRSTDAAEGEEFDMLEAEVKQLDDDIKRLSRLEELNKSKATPVEGGGGGRAAASRGGDHNVLALRPKLEKGILFARHAMCVFAAKGNLSEAGNLARQHYGEDSPVAKALGWSGSRSMESVLKAAVAAGTTQDATWAKPLVEYVNYAGDFVDYLRPRTLIGRFGQGNIPALRRIPFNVHIKGQTVGGTGYWVGEGKPKPVTKFGFEDTYHGWFKVAAISVLTDELIRFSDPSAETYVRDSLGDVLVERMDTDFINPAFAGAANVSPASILYGVTAIPSSGTDVDAALVDIDALWDAGDAANHVFDTPVYITRAAIARKMSGLRNALGQKMFPDVTAAGGSIEGVPLLVSNYVPAGVFALVNASDIYLSDDGQATVDFSREASIQMLDNPTNASSDGTATTLVSMFQNDSTALRAHRFVNYSRRRPTAVAYLTGVAWTNAQEEEGGGA